MPKVHAAVAQIPRTRGETPVVLYDTSGRPILTVPFQFDDTDKLAVSLYVQGTAAGDTPLERLTGSGNNSLKVAIFGGQGEVSNRQAADAYNNADYGLSVFGMTHLFNASTWDRARNNVALTLLASAARTAETNSADFICYNGRNLIVVVNVSAITATPVLTPKLQLKDPISSNYLTIWTAAATLTAVGTYAYLFAIGGSGSAGGFTEVSSIRVPRTWRFQMSVADADSATYSVAGVDLV